MAQEVLQKPITLPRIQLPKLNLEYPSFAGKPASSNNNWVPIDFVNAKLASILGVSDEKPNAS